MPYAYDKYEHSVLLVYAATLNIFFGKIIHKWFYSQKHGFFPTELDALRKA